MALVNGEKVSTVSHQDRGLQFGDGLFETIAIYNGEILYWSEHWQRLSEGCKRLFIPLPDESVLVKEIQSLLKDKPKQVIKLVYTRGVSERGYKFEQLQPTRIISRTDWPKFDSKNAKEGIELFICQTRLAHQPLLAGLKHLNRLENVLARHEWQDNKYAEGLMFDVNNLVIEGTMSNIFMVENDELYTPDLTQCGLAGITRQRILNYASKENIVIKVCEINKNKLLEADEIFMCNSLIGIWPVKNIDGQVFGTLENENPITRFLQQNIISPL